MTRHLHRSIVALAAMTTTAIGAFSPAVTAAIATPTRLMPSSHPAQLSLQVAATPGNAASSRFRDITNDVYQQEINAAVERGLIAGFEDNTFRPQATLTREQLVSMVMDALSQLPNYTGAPITPPLVDVVPTTNSFGDVDASRWSAAKIQVAHNLQIVSGYPDGSFRPNQPVTRAELIRVLRNAAAYGQVIQGGSQEIRDVWQPRTFNDIEGHWASDSITLLSGYCGVASPLNEAGNAFAPNTAARRNYAAAATLRMLRCITRSPHQSPGM